MVGSLVLAVIVGACADDEVPFVEDDGIDGPIGTAYSLDEVCGVTAERLCAAREDCCQLVGVGFDQATCVARETSECEQTSKAAVERGDATFDQ